MEPFTLPSKDGIYIYFKILVVIMYVIEFLKRIYIDIINGKDNLIKKN